LSYSNVGYGSRIGLRAGFSGNYVVYYRPAETELTIVRILHGARDTAAISSSGGFV
jgi:toxin ParE1/3/4